MYIIITHVQKRSQDGLRNRYKIFELVFYIQIWSPVGVGAFLLKIVFIFLMHIIKTHVQKRSQDGLQNRYKIFELVFLFKYGL